MTERAPSWDLFAGIPVRDRATAVRWYEQLLGAPPSFLPNDTEAVWQVAGHGFLYVDVRPAHAGHAMHTVFVDDLPRCLADVAARGLRPTTTERYDSGVDKAVFHDPDGNEIGIAGQAG